MKTPVLVALLVAAVVPIAAQQAPTFVPPPIEQMKQQRVSVSAAGTMLLSGDVELSFVTDGVTIHADEAEYRKSTNDMLLRGDVFLSVPSLPAMNATTVTRIGEGMMQFRGDVDVLFGTKKTVIHADEADYDNTAKTLQLRGNVRLEFVKDSPRH